MGDGPSRPDLELIARSSNRVLRRCKTAVVRVMRRLVLIALVSFTASAQTFDRFSVHAAGGKSLKTWHGQATIEALNIEIGRH